MKYEYRVMFRCFYEAGSKVWDKVTRSWEKLPEGNVLRACLVSGKRT